MGRPELVDEAIDHLLNLEEEYVSPSAHATVLDLVARVEWNQEWLPPHPKLK